MDKLAVLLFFIPFPLFAQSVQTISQEQCLWHAGDNLAWATPGFDDSGWQPFTGWHLEARTPQIWIRCHLDLSPLANLAHPALQFENGRAFAAFFNGRSIGVSGNLANGQYTDNLAPVFRIPESADLQHALVAMHITYRSYEEKTPVRIYAGEMQWLTDRHNSVALIRSHIFMPLEVCYLAIGFAGFVLLAMYANDRRRLELLLLAACCFCMFINRTVEFIDVTSIAIPWILSSSFFVIGQCLGLPLIWFFFQLAGKHVPWIFRALILDTLLYPLQLLLTLFLPVHLSLRISTTYFAISPIQLAIEGIGSVAAPLVAFWPWGQIGKRLRSLALCCLLWATADAVWIALVVLNSASAEEDTLAQNWVIPLLYVRALFILGVIVSMVALLFRDQRRTAEERAMLVGEMEAARAVQQVIVPERIPSIPGFAIASAYEPAGEVGGDFFQIVPTPCGGVLAVIGDVSGKGAPAAMTVSLLVGTFRTLAHYTHSPAEILRAMNQRMIGRNSGGFTTCLAIRIDPDGKVAAANAGHLAPYVDGKELPIENSLPIGLTTEVQYAESVFQLHSSAQLTLITDGIIEARNPEGDLFGFERTAAISTQTAEAIARAAQAFGQEDDITVLSLTFAPVEVAQA